MVLAALFLALSQQSGIVPAAVQPVPPSPDQVIVKVNGSPILAKDIEAYLWDWRGPEVTQDLVVYRLIQDEARASGVEVSSAEVDKALATQVSSFKQSLPPGTDVDKTLRDRGFPKSRFYMKVHSDLLLDRIAGKAFKPDQFVRISTIAFTPKSEDATELSKAIQRAQNAHHRLESGGDWNKEVQASDDPDDLKQHMGLLGWRLVSAFPAPTQAEFKAARVGSALKPVQAAGAVQVFRFEGWGSSATAAEQEDLRKQFIAAERAKLIAKIQSGAHVEKVFGTKP